MGIRNRTEGSAGRLFGLALGFVVLALGVESTVRVVTEWATGGDLTLATGMLMVVGGTGLLLGSRSTLGVAAWVLRAQLAVTALVTALTVWAQVAAAVPSGRIPIAPLAFVLATGAGYVAVCVVALRWIRKRLNEP